MDEPSGRVDFFPMEPSGGKVVTDDTKPAVSQEDLRRLFARHSVGGRDPPLQCCCWRCWCRRGWRGGGVPGVAGGGWMNIVMTLVINSNHHDDDHHHHLQHLH